MLEGSLITTLIGGLTGLAGTVWSSYNQRKLKALEMADHEQQRSHDLAMLKAESQAMALEAKVALHTQQAKVQGAIELSEAHAFHASQGLQGLRIFSPGYMDRLFDARGRERLFTLPCALLLSTLFGLSDAVKSLARPGITAYLLTLSTWTTINAMGVLATMDPAEIKVPMAVAIIRNTSDILLYLTVTSVTWWFGDRMASKNLAGRLAPGKHTP